MRQFGLALSVVITIVYLIRPMIAEAQSVSASVTANLNGVLSSDSESTTNGPVSASMDFPDAASLDFSGIGQALAAQQPDGVAAVFVEALFANGTPQNIITSTTTWSDSDTNNSGSPVAYDFQYTITPGRLRIGDFANVTENHTPHPIISYSLVIRANGVPVFDSSATLEGGTSSHILTEAGTSLNPVFVGPGTVFGYDFQSRSATIDLGFVNPGESISVDYEMTARVITGGNEAGGLAEIGDPFDLSGNPGFSGSLRANGVVATESRSWANVKSLYN